MHVETTKRRIATFHSPRGRLPTLLCTDQRLSRQIFALPSMLLSTVRGAPWRTPRRACRSHQNPLDSVTTAADGINGVLRWRRAIIHDLLVRAFFCRTRCLDMRDLALPSSITRSCYSLIDTEFLPLSKMSLGSGGYHAMLPNRCQMILLEIRGSVFLSRAGVISVASGSWR